MKGNCIFHPCTCTQFAEATEEQIAEAIREVHEVQAQLENLQTKMDHL